MQFIFHSSYSATFLLAKDLCKYKMPNSQRRHENSKNELIETSKKKKKIKRSLGETKFIGLIFCCNVRAKWILIFKFLLFFYGTKTFIWRRILSNISWNSWVYFSRGKIFCFLLCVGSWYFFYQVPHILKLCISYLSNFFQIVLSIVNDVNTISLDFVCKKLNRYSVKKKTKGKTLNKKLNLKVSMPANNLCALILVFSSKFFGF